jgi:hypothetical protein
MRHLVSSGYMLDKYTFECFTLFHVSQTNFVQVGILLSHGYLYL